MNRPDPLVNYRVAGDNRRTQLVPQPRAPITDWFS